MTLDEPIALLRIPSQETPKHRDVMEVGIQSKVLSIPLLTLGLVVLTFHLSISSYTESGKDC